jgi:hypothetical protein
MQSRNNPPTPNTLNRKTNFSNHQQLGCTTRKRTQTHPNPKLRRSRPWHSHPRSSNTAGHSITKGGKNTENTLEQALKQARKINRILTAGIIAELIVLILII